MIITIANVRGFAKTSEAFKRRTWEVAQGIQTSPDNLAAIMSFESGGTFSPSIKNAAGSGAVGLIQFMPSTAKSLGTSTEALAAMTDVQQLDYVAKYFAWFGKGRLVTLEDTYCAVLWPAAIGKSNDFVLFSAGTKAYEQNRGFDVNKTGHVTKADVSRSIRKLYEAAEGRVPVDVGGAQVATVEPPEDSSEELAKALEERFDLRSILDSPVV